MIRVFQRLGHFKLRVEMASLLLNALEGPGPLAAFILCALTSSLFIYVIYQRYFHPLAEFPGPFMASLTDLWQVNQFLGLKQPYNLTELHEKHGQFVRYGPDKISITAEDAVPLIYQKGGRNLPKTEFYDAYGAKIPNVFGMRDQHVRCSAFCTEMALTEGLYRCTRFEDATCPIASPLATLRVWNNT